MTSPTFNVESGTRCTSTIEPGRMAGRMLPVGTARVLYPSADQLNSSSTPQPTTKAAITTPSNTLLTQLIFNFYVAEGWLPTKLIVKVPSVLPVTLLSAVAVAEQFQISPLLRLPANVCGVACRLATVEEKLLPLPQSTLIVTLFQSSEEPPTSSGILAVIFSGISPLLCRQNVTGSEAFPGTNLALNPGVDEVSPSGQLVLAPIARVAVADESWLFDSATVFDCSCANVTAPTRAAIAPIVPTARAIGLILRILSIRCPPV